MKTLKKLVYKTLNPFLRGFMVFLKLYIKELLIT